MPRITAAAICVVLLSIVHVALLAPPARASETYPRPANGAWSVSGHGFGHGHGMSQWGASGAAAQGVSWTTILATYYPGTARSTRADSTIKVRVTPDASETRLSGSDGLVVSDGSGFSTALPHNVTQWRMTPSLRGFHLEGLTDAWRVYPLNGNTEITSYVRFDNAAQMHRVWRSDNTSVDYRGAVISYPSGGSVITLIQLYVEEYLRGVVPKESVSSWPLDALRAQAVAPRNFASYFQAHPAGSVWDICDTTSCQVFGGTASYSSTGVRSSVETSRTDAAVADTRGVVLTYAGGIALTQYSASNGGWSTDGGLPYLVAKPDPWDGSAPGDPVHSWNATLGVSELEARFPAIGSLVSLSVDQRDGNGDWGGRVLSVTLTGSSGTVHTTGSAIAGAHGYPTYSDGLRSRWFVISTNAPTGSLDLVESSGESLRVAGWAIDPDVSSSIRVHVYVDGAFVTEVLADRPRPDVAAVFPSIGAAHGYDVSVPIVPGSHQVCVFAINSVPPGPNPELGCRAVTVPPSRPFGPLDAATWDGSAIHLSGWSIDPDTPAAVHVHAYLDGQFGVDVVADRARPDVAVYYPAYGPNHGYDLTLPAGPGTHQVCVYAINVGAGAGVVNPLLGCRPVEVPPSNPIGAMDQAERVGADVSVKGWTIDPDTASPIHVHLYVDGGFAADTVADRPRPDVWVYYPAYGPNHGFEVRLPMSAAAREVCAYAINVGAGAGVINPLLGCRSVPAT